MLVVSIGFIPAYATSPNAFFMQTNSTGKIFANYTRDNNENNDMKIYASVSSYSSDSRPDPRVISLSVQPNSLVNHQTTPVTFTITASNDSKGIYNIQFGICGEYYMLLVGINESEVDSEIIHDYLLPHMQEGCIGPTNLFSQEMVVTGYSNITPITLSEPSTTPEFPFAIPILVISIASLILLYRTKIVR